MNKCNFHRLRGYMTLNLAIAKLAMNNFRQTDVLFLTTKWAQMT